MKINEGTTEDFPIHGKDLFNQPEGFYETPTLADGNFLLLVKSESDRTAVLRIEKDCIRVAFTNISQFKDEWRYRRAQHKLYIQVK